MLFPIGSLGTDQNIKGVKEAMAQRHPPTTIFVLSTTGTKQHLSHVGRLWASVSYQLVPNLSGLV